MPKTAIGLTLLQIALLVLATLWVNNGTFVYALDDPYIHLDLSDMIARSGLYGVNAGQVQAPSSSILWPFLLVPFAWTPFHLFVPLGLNVLFAALCAWTLGKIILRLGHGEKLPPFIVLGLTLWAVNVLNLPALSLLGMEHVLQVWLALLAAYGLMVSLDEKRVPWWVWGVLLLNPLVRYEGLGVAAFTLAVLFWQGHFRRTILCGVIIACAMLAFSAFLVSFDLYPIPSSTIAKKSLGIDYWSVIDNNFSAFSLNLSDMTVFAWSFCLGVFFLLYRPTLFTPRWMVAVALAAFPVLHFFGGLIAAPWQAPRYTFYLYAFCLPLSLWLMLEAAGGERVQKTIKKAGSFVFLSLVGFFAATTGVTNGVNYVIRDSHTIYLQQEQNRRFIMDFWQKPVAVNDIGLAGYRNPHLVFDLVGLSNAEIIPYRLTNQRALWQKVVDQNIELAIVYPYWFHFERYSEWTPLGFTHCGACSYAVGYHTTYFFTPQAEKADAIQDVLMQWAKTLPKGTFYVPLTHRREMLD